MVLVLYLLCIKKWYPLNLKYKYLYLFASAISIVLAFTLSPHHDYWAYLEQWDNIINGDSAGNPYGIVHDFIGYLSLFPIVYVPKALFVCIYLLGGYKLLDFALAEGVNAGILSVFLLLNPLFLIFGVYYGSNDLFVSGLTILAVLYLIDQKSKIAGILFAFAIGYKFYPLFILPFLLFSIFKLRKGFAYSFMISLLIIYSVGYLYWGDSVFDAFRIGLERPSKSLSIFRFIRGESSPITFLGIENADSLSVWFLFGSFLGSMFLFLYYRLDYLLMALFSYVNVLLFFKIGHHQFYFLFLFLSLLVYIKHKTDLKQNKPLIISFAIFIIWFFAIVIAYPLTEQYNSFPQIREWIGLPNFVMLLIFNVLLLRYTFQKSYSG